MPLDQNVLHFLEKHRVGVLAITLEDGSPHAATMHYSMRDEPFKLFFATARDSKKGQALEGKKHIKASVVVGFDPKEWTTIQLDGELKVVTDPEQIDLVKAIHYANNPDSRARHTEPETLMLVFTPTWWRYSNFQAEPPVVIGSEQ
jgi:general stress protein 26